jgi:hypothetical protein
MDKVVLAERIAHERELRQAQLAAFDHERELRAVFDAHERELRQQNEAAVEKARQLQFEVYESRLEHMNEFRSQLSAQAATFLTVDRFEREHRVLIDRYEREAAVLSEKVSEQESVTVRQDAQQDLLAASQTNHRWLIGISIGIIGIALSSGLALVALVLHLAGLY